ncbi:sodium/glutamate symporter [Chengkuizengella sediminis]|uniref:sodium/glutamate symporter n=1 Tax=Chengkuizengella sediminis TaxID=1885917 RepID=UPI0013893B48|nr:sodium/glutamate symporter [Chengkuizengella sediminis]NDI34264.1 hypothetical protein [Chengkuizengella sediminis]
MFILHNLTIISLLFIGLFIEKRWKLSKYYISPALAGGMIAMIVSGILYYFYSYTFIPNEWVVCFFVTAFLFSIGMKMGLTYQKKHIKHLFYLFGFSTFILAIIELIAMILFKNNSFLLQVYNSQTFSWNEEWIFRIQNWFSGSLVFQFHFSLIIVFILTPVVIRLMRNFQFSEMKPYKTKDFHSWKLNAVMILFLVTIFALFLKNMYLDETLFIFDFVISMVIGFVLGRRLKTRDSSQVDQWISSVLSAGTLSLYGFIISMIFISSVHVWTGWSWNIVGLYSIKLILFTLLWIWVSRRWVKNHQKLVLISACWAFTLSAPVTCMNAMHSVVRRHGPADQVLLLIPPVILWLINYPHYWLLAFLYN